MLFAEESRAVGAIETSCVGSCCTGLGVRLSHTMWLVFWDGRGWGTWWGLWSELLQTSLPILRNYVSCSLCGDQGAERCQFLQGTPANISLCRSALIGLRCLCLSSENSHYFAGWSFAAIWFSACWESFLWSMIPSRSSRAQGLDLVAHNPWRCSCLSCASVRRRAASSACWSLQYPALTSLPHWGARLVRLQNMTVVSIPVDSAGSGHCRTASSWFDLLFDWFSAWCSIQRTSWALLTLPRLCWSSCLTDSGCVGLQLPSCVHSELFALWRSRPGWVLAVSACPGHWHLFVAFGPNLAFEWVDLHITLMH